MSPSVKWSRTTEYIYAPKDTGYGRLMGLRLIIARDTRRTVDRQGARGRPLGRIRKSILR